MKGKLGSNVPMQPTIPKMPSNTSNALEALDSVNATQFNALDSISRQAAINALERTKRIASYELHGGEVLRTFNVVLNSLINIMSLLPPANNSEIPNSSDTISRAKAIEALNRECRCGAVIDHCGLETAMDIISELPPAQLSTNLAEVGTDCISRQAAIDALRAMQTYKLFAGDDMLLIDQAGAQTELMMLPPAQPEPKRGKWIYKTDLITAPTGYWECSECKEGKLLYEENFCPNCGADMRGEQDG